MRWARLLPELEQHFTVYAIDRRGRGGSGDAVEYVIEREFEDVAAVVDAIVITMGDSATLAPIRHLPRTPPRRPRLMSSPR